MTPITFAILAVACALINLGARMAKIGHPPNSEEFRLTSNLAGITGFATVGLMVAALGALII